MKTYLNTKKRKVSVYMLAFLMLLGSVLNYNIKVSAHEVFDPNIKIRFTDLNSWGLPDLKVYVATTLTNQLYLNNYATAISNWNNVYCNKGYVTAKEVKNIDDANIHLMCSDYLWTELGKDPSAFGFTTWQDINYNTIKKEEDILGNRVDVKRAMVIMNTNINPITDGATTSTIKNNRVIKTMVHEMGHGMGLGHPNRPEYEPISDDIYSVMRQGYPDTNKTRTSPQVHDKDDLANMY